MHQLGLSFDIRDPGPSWDMPAEPPRARSSDPETSHEAAAKAHAFAGTHEAKIIEALATPGTIKQLAQRIGIDHVAVARRMKALERAQLAEPMDEKIDGCRVWRRKASA